MFGKLRSCMGTSKFLKMRHVSKAWWRVISLVEEWATISLHRDRNLAVVFLKNTHSLSSLDENIKYSIDTLRQRAPSFGERLRVDIARCTIYVEEYLTWANASERDRDIVDLDYRRVFREVWFYSVNEHHDYYKQEPNMDNCDDKFEFYDCQRTWRFPIGHIL